MTWGSTSRSFRLTCTMVAMLDGVLGGCSSPILVLCPPGCLPRVLPPGRKGWVVCEPAEQPSCNRSTSPAPPAMRTHSLQQAHAAGHTAVRRAAVASQRLGRCLQPLFRTPVTRRTSQQGYRPSAMFSRLLGKVRAAQVAAEAPGQAIRRVVWRAGQATQHIQRAAAPACKSAPPLAGGRRLQAPAEAASAAPPAGSAASFKDNAPSWEELQQLVDSRREALGVFPADPVTASGLGPGGRVGARTAPACRALALRALHVYAVLPREEGASTSDCGWLLQGPANPHALKRTFGQPGEPQIKLYRDHAAWCPYCELYCGLWGPACSRIASSCRAAAVPMATADDPRNELPAREHGLQRPVQSSVAQLWHVATGARCMWPHPHVHPLASCRPQNHPAGAAS